MIATESLNTIDAARSPDLTPMPVSSLTAIGDRETNEDRSGELDALALSMARANGARLARLRFQGTANIVDSRMAATLKRLMLLEEEGFAATHQAVSTAPLSDTGKLEAWYLFLANRP